MVRVARVHLAIYVATIALALWTRSWLPLMIIGLPRMYGAWHGILCGLLQHGGLADNVTDHRLNSRTVLMNPRRRATRAFRRARFPAPLGAPAAPCPTAAACPTAARSR